jgi:hypothetical protein
MSLRAVDVSIDIRNIEFLFCLTVRCCEEVKLAHLLVHPIDKNQYFIIARVRHIAALSYAPVERINKQCMAGKWLLRLYS